MQAIHAFKTLRLLYKHNNTPVTDKNFLLLKQISRKKQFTDAALSFYFGSITYFHRQLFCFSSLFSCKQRTDGKKLSSGIVRGLCAEARLTGRHCFWFLRL
jgi:hypothetical protein